MRNSTGWRKVGTLCLSLMFGVLAGCDEQPATDAAAAVQETPGSREGELCVASTDCAANEYCATIEGACGREGVCTAIPELCESTREPVCGCDGRDYENPCFAAQAQQSVQSTGTCGPPPCYSNSDCVATSYCAKATGDCGGTGTCKARPMLCSGLFKPVCGCNQATYGNACKAGSVGVSLFKTGAC